MLRAMTPLSRKGVPVNQPSVGAAMNTNTNTISSGVLRTTLTYTSAARRSTATGPTRIAPSSVPTTSETRPDRTRSCSVSQKAWRTRLKFEVTSSTWSPPQARPQLLVRGSLAGVELRRVRGLDARLAQRRLERRLPASVVEGLLEGVGDPLAHLGGVLGVAHAVPLLREGVDHDLELVGVLRGVPEQDRAVGRHGLDGAAEHLVDALGIRVEPTGLGALGLDVVQRRRTGDRADLLPLDVVEGVDVGVRAHQELLAGDVVGARLADHLAPLVGDGVRRDHQVDLTGLQEGLAVVRDGLLPRDVALRDPECSGQDLADLRVEPLGRVVSGPLEAEAGLVVLDTDDDLAGVGELLHAGAVVELVRCVVRHLDIGPAAV